MAANGVLLATPTDSPQNQKEPVQNDPKKKESQFKKTETRKKEIIQNEIQTRQKKKQTIGGDKIQIGDARKKRTTDRKWLTNNRYEFSQPPGSYVETCTSFYILSGPRWLTNRIRYWTSTRSHHHSSTSCC